MEIIGPSNVFVRREPDGEDGVLAAMTSARSRLPGRAPDAGHDRSQ
jgi:hypothetical protein